MFTHLHTHSEYSLLDGLSKIPALVAQAQELGQDALAVTDHGALYGAIELYEAANERGIKPIIGLEAYAAHGSRTTRTPAEKSPFHLTLLAQNETGYRNLIKLSSASHLEGFYYKPRVDRELLERHAEGLIVLSGCPSGEVMGALAEGREQDAIDTLGWYKDVFPGRYYVEVQEHQQEQFSRLTPALVDLARRLDLPLVLTNDSHYTVREQHRAHDILLCIGTNATVQQQNRMRMEGESFYLKSEQEMRALLPELPEAADNTARIAEQVDIRLQFGRSLLPEPGIPEGMTAEQHLRALCDQGAARRYGALSDEQRERLQYELNLIEETGFVEYMLIVEDIARFARSRTIPMGVRGSAAASMVLYCLNVTDIEPTQYRLTFDRFLHAERISMPDVDFDFADDRRDEVIRYTAERFGRDRVAQIITFGTLGARAAIRDTGRALDMSYGDTDRVARMIPETLHITIDDALASVRDLQEAYEGDPAVRDLIDTARGVEGVARHASTHAAGVVITREPLTDVVPLQRAPASKDRTGDGEAANLLPTTQYAMNDVEHIGLLKLDFLGLTNLTILGHAVDLIRKHQGIEVVLSALPDGDPATAALLADGHTFGVFQLESTGMRRYVTELQPQDIREVAAMVALYRPGPMEIIPQYIDVKHGRAQPHYLHEDLAEILDESYGLIIYQDQALEIARRFAGYTAGQADVMRKAMGKKIPAVMLAERERFIGGAVALGHETHLAEQIFDLIEPFAGYGFNKAHAFSYGVIAYQTAYLKAHYPVEYMTAVMVAAGGSHDRIAAAIADSARQGIAVLPPDVTRSGVTFQIEPAEDGKAAIRYGLAHIKNVGTGAVEQIVASREADGTFESLEDFARRISPREVNRRALESLAKAGALDALGDRAAIVTGIDRILSLAQQEQRLRETGQTSMFDMFGSEVATPLPALDLETGEAPQRELLAWEKELLGTYLTAHPFKQAAPRLAEFVTVQLAELTADLAGQEAVVAGTVAGVRPLVTRQGKAFAAVTIEDLSGSAELTVWPDGYEQHRALLGEGTVLLVRVEIRERGDRLTVAVLDLAACDPVSGDPSGADPSRFRPRTRRAARGKGGRKGSDSGNGNGNGNGDGNAAQESSRPALHAVDSAPPGTADAPSGAPQSGGDHDSTRDSARDSARDEGIEPEEMRGPRRVRIEMEETTDEPADRRRMSRLCARLAETPGDVPVEIIVRTRSGSTERLHFTPIASPAELIPDLKRLLGVLGDAREVGEAAEVPGVDVLVAAGAG